MKRLVFLTAIIFSFFIIQSLIVSIYTIWQKHDLLVSAQNDLALEKKKNQELKNKLTYVGTQDFIEQEARNKLFMVKPGEKRIIIDEKAIAALIKKEGQKRENKLNWQRWWDLFF